MEYVWERDHRDLIARVTRPEGESGFFAYLIDEQGSTLVVHDCSFQSLIEAQRRADAMAQARLAHRCVGCGRWVQVLPERFRLVEPDPRD